jgi:hypothetical protein
MTRISNADQVLLLLHEQLDRLARKRSAGSTRARSPSVGTPEPMARLRARAAQEGIAEEDLKRALVRGLLAQQLGDAIANDPAFEVIAGDVARMIGESEEGRALLDRALIQLND